MLIDLSPEELRSIRAVLIWLPSTLCGLTEEMRERIVLKLHASIEGMLPNGFDVEDEDRLSTE